MTVLETDRLVLSHLTHDDDAFILELVNDPDFLRHIGDRAVRNREDARRYIDGPRDSYIRHGFGYRIRLPAGLPGAGLCL